MTLAELAAHIAAQVEQANLNHSGFVVIDALFPADVAGRIASAFPRDGKGFTRLRSFRERKFTSNAFDAHAPLLKETAFALQHPDVIAAAETAAGMRGLMPDPSSYAGGLSLMVPGDFLNPHIDNSHNGSRALYRRLNLLYYANPGWRDGDGGELELWDTHIRKRVRIKPRCNRLVIMETNRTSWHSVAPIRRGNRRCVSTYYFSEASPDGSDYYHVTSFTGRPEQPVRRALAAIDNGARQFARVLGATRASDKGYQVVNATHAPASL